MSQDRHSIFNWKPSRISKAIHSPQTWSAGGTARQARGMRGLSRNLAIPACLFLSGQWPAHAVDQRFPPPEFSTHYHAPVNVLPAPPMQWMAYLDAGLLFLALLLASYLVLTRRSRRGVFALMVVSLAYFGFYRHGCVCAVGAVQNLALSLGSGSYVLPLSIGVIFLLPLAFALFTGRVFCSSVCPLGAVQDLVLIRPVRVPAWLEHALGILPALYLGAGILFAATGSAFVICQYDPFVALFRSNGSTAMLVFAGLLLVLGFFVGRPYCRFLCPYGLMLRWLSPLARWRVQITPQECVQCHLCQDACPFGAIHAPAPIRDAGQRRASRAPVVLAIIALPLIVASMGWLGHHSYTLIAHVDPTVRLADRVYLESTGRVHGTTLASDAYHQLGRPAGELYWQATRILRRYRTGATLFGLWIGLFIGLKLISLCLRRHPTDYEASAASCLSCGRCYSSCPVERARWDSGFAAPLTPTGQPLPARLDLSGLAASRIAGTSGPTNGAGLIPVAELLSSGASDNHGPTPAGSPSWLLSARSWRRTATMTAVIAGVFCLVTTGLLIASHVRGEGMHPLAAPHLDALKAQLVKSPTNEHLKDEIRALDLQMREGYFRRMEFESRGLSLLMGGLAVLFLSLEWRRQLLRDDLDAIPFPDHVAPPPDPFGGESRSIQAVMVMALGIGAALYMVTAGPSADLSRQYARLATRPVIKRPSAAAGQPAQTGSPLLLAASPLQAQNPGGPTTPSTGGAVTLPAPGMEAPGASSAGGAAGALATLPAAPASSKGRGSVVLPEPSTPAPATAYPSPQEIVKNWPYFRGPSGMGFCWTTAAPIKWDGAKGQNILWKSPVPLPGRNSPIVWGSRVFISGADANHRSVFCYDAGTGKLLWTGAVSGVPGSSPTPPKVQDDTGFAAPTMATDGRHAFALFANGDVACFDYSGQRIWALNLGTPDSTYGFASSLTMYRSLLIIQYDQGNSADDGKSSILALDAATGRLAWRTKRPVCNSWTTPIIINDGHRDLLVTAANPFVIAYDPGSGKELWRAECLSGDVAPSPVFAGGMVFAVNQGANLNAIRPGGSGDVTKSQIVWMASDNLPDICSPVTNGKYVFLLTSEGTLTCVDAATGKEAWEHSYDNAEFRSSPNLVGNKLYLIDTHGVTHMAAAAGKFQDLGSCPLGDKVTTVPAVVGAHIYIRGEAFLYCIGARP